MDTTTHEPSAKPKVLIVTGTLMIGGGAEKVAAALGSELTARGYEAHLLTFYEADEKYPFTGIYHTFGEPIIHNRFKKILRVPQRIWKIYRYARKHKVQVVVSFLEEANFYCLLMKLCLYWRLPVVVSVRNNIEKREWPFRLATRLLYPFAKQVVAVTKVVEHQLRTRFGLKRVTTIYNPLDMSVVKERMQQPLAPEYQWLTERSPLLITVGRLIHQKAQWHLVRAFTKVREAHPSATLVILGEGEYREKLERLIAECGLSESVYLLGKHPNVYQFNAVADLFVFSSLFEGMPNTVLEAYAVGVPIVSVDSASGPREILAPNAPVTDPITYPYETPIGTLTPLPSGEEIWAPPTAAPLTPAEQALATAISTKLTNLPKKHNLATTDERFQLTTIIDAWERLLTN